MKWHLELVLSKVLALLFKLSLSITFHIGNFSKPSMYCIINNLIEDLCMKHVNLLHVYITIPKELGLFGQIRYRGGSLKPPNKQYFMKFYTLLSFVTITPQNFYTT